ncbi:MAG TPA: DUF1772 domain-containing protein [Acidobacteriaceae bacterium]
MMLILNLATTLCIGLMIGTEFAVSVFVNPVIYTLDESTQARTIRLFAARLGAAMPFWYALGFVLLVAETILLRHTAAAGLLVAASAVWAIVIVLTLILLVPINNRMARMETSDFHGYAQREHHKWDRLHRLRVAVLSAAMVCFLIAIGV